MTTKAELACVYASLILVDDDVAVTVSETKYQKSKLIFIIIIYSSRCVLIVGWKNLHNFKDGKCWSGTLLARTLR